MLMPLSVVVPVHNEEACGVELHRRLCATLGAIDSRWELIVVDDGSPERTYDAILEVSGSDEREIYRSHLR
jgi:glycosyltransferase involved in cell wall biosynthesis